MLNVKAISLSVLWALCLGTEVSASVAKPEFRVAEPMVTPEKSVVQTIVSRNERIFSAGERGLIMYSDDYGSSWMQSQVPVSVTLTAMSLPSEQGAWAVGHFGTVLKSQDHGETWTQVFDGVSAAKLVFSDVESRLKGDINDAEPSVQREYRNAKHLLSDGPDKPFLAVHFFDDDHGFIVGAYNLAFETTDGGETWQVMSGRFDNPGARHLYDIAASGDNVYVVGEEGLLFRSVDKGKTFEKLKSPYEGSFFTVAIKDECVLAAGLRGNAFISNDLGEQWQSLDINQPVSIVDSEISSSGEILLLNQAGAVFNVDMEAANIADQQQYALPPLTSLLELPTKDLMLGTVQGIYFNKESVDN